MLAAQAYPTCSSVPPMLRMMNGMAVHSTFRPIAIVNAAPYNGQTPAGPLLTDLESTFCISTPKRTALYNEADIPQ